MPAYSLWLLRRYAATEAKALWPHCQVCILWMRERCIRTPSISQKWCAQRRAALSGVRRPSATLWASSSVCLVLCAYTESTAKSKIYSTIRITVHWTGTVCTPYARTLRFNLNWRDIDHAADELFFATRMRETVYVTMLDAFKLKYTATRSVGCSSPRRCWGTRSGQRPLSTTRYFARY